MMRFTVLDPTSTVSFAGPGHCLKALVAGCSHGASDFASLLDRVRQYDHLFANHVLFGLARFDEHVLPEDLASVERWLEREDVERKQVFRVFNQRLRNMSLDPERLGVVLFNLPERRIVQIQNAYGELLRQDRGRIRIGGNPVNRFYHYSLPGSWSLLP